MEDFTGITNDLFVSSEELDDRKEYQSYLRESIHEARSAGGGLREAIEILNNKHTSVQEEE